MPPVVRPGEAHLGVAGFHGLLRVRLARLDGFEVRALRLRLVGAYLGAGGANGVARARDRGAGGGESNCVLAMRSAKHAALLSQAPCHRVSPVHPRDAWGYGISRRASGYDPVAATRIPR